jgi:hypothetical protein
VSDGTLIEILVLFLMAHLNRFVFDNFVVGDLGYVGAAQAFRAQVSAFDYVTGAEFTVLKNDARTGRFEHESPVTPAPEMIVTDEYKGVKAEAEINICCNQRAMPKEA